MIDLVAQFEMHYPRGAKIQAEFSRPANGFSITAIFGPSGCGKTTVLRCLAGLERPQRGTIALGNDVWFDCKQGIHRSPMERNIGFLFQEYALFPHLTVLQNIGYGLRQQSSAERQRMVYELLDRFELIGLEDRYPHQISGGQQQRVALARTLARRPILLLLDEPLAALDTMLREKMLSEIRHILADFAIPVFFVSHDRREVSALADHLIIMEQGRILQSGRIIDVFARPTNEATAKMVGLKNLYQGRVIERTDTTTTVLVGSVTLISTSKIDPEGEVLICIREGDIEVTPTTMERIDRPNCLSATVRNVTRENEWFRINLDCGFSISALLPSWAVKSRQLEIGMIVNLHIPSDSVHLIPKSVSTDCIAAPKPMCPDT